MKIYNIETYSTFNEGKIVVPKRFTRAFIKTISKNVYFDGLDDIIDKYNNTVHRTIKM